MRRHCRNICIILVRILARFHVVTDSQQTKHILNFKGFIRDLDALPDSDLGALLHIFKAIVYLNYYSLFWQCVARLMLSFVCIRSLYRSGDTTIHVYAYDCVVWIWSAHTTTTASSNKHRHFEERQLSSRLHADHAFHLVGKVNSGASLPIPIDYTLLVNRWHSLRWSWL